MFYYRIPDYWEMSFIQDVLLPDDNFLDVGANVGVYTLLAASLIENGTIVAIEPNPSARRMLHDNISLNQLNSARVLDFAVGARTGWARMTAHRGPMNHVTDVVFDQPRPAGEGWIQIAPLDDLIGSHRPFLAKLDVEGLELAALQGATQCLKAARPAAWLVEVSDFADRFGSSSSALASFIEAHGGVIRKYDPGSRTLLPIQPTRDRTINILAVFDEPAINERLARNSRS